jgi:hypothetical protein
MKRPLGVTATAALTLLSALALFLLQLVLVALSAVGGPPPSGTSYTLPLYYYIPTFLACCAFAVSIGQFLGAKWAWYASIAFWIILLIFFGWAAYLIDFSHGIIWLDAWGYFVSYGFQEFLATLIPLIYAAGAIAYFLTKNVRDYFHIR